MEAEKLEIVKVGISAITPILVAGIGWLLAGRLKNIEQLQWGNRKLTEKRIQIYEKVSPLLNRLYCYFIYIGDWQAHSPKDIISTKRMLDHEMHVNKYLLEPQVFKAYEEFIATLFELYNGAGKDAKLKTLIFSDDGDRRMSPSFSWADGFDECFAMKGVEAKSTVAERYDAVMKAQRLGIKA